MVPPWNGEEKKMKNEETKKVNYDLEEAYLKYLFDRCELLDEDLFQKALMILNKKAKAAQKKL